MSHIEQTSAIEIMETRISFSEMGRGKSLLLLHGNPGSRRDFSAIAPHLADDSIKCLYPDRPGHMSSEEIIYDEPDPWLETKLYAELIDKKADGKTTIIGYSLGCFVAAKIAIKYPEKVDGLCFIAPYLTPDNKSEKPSSIPEMAKGAFVGTLLGVLLPLLSQNKMTQHLKNVFQPEKLPEGFLETWLPRYTRFESLMATMSDKNSMLTILNEVHEKMAEIKCPIKIIAGKEDKVCSSSDQISLCKEKATQSEIIEIENAGHALPFTHAEECAKIIEGML